MEHQLPRRRGRPPRIPFAADTGCIIKKYGNRRLYDTKHGRYINHEALLDLIAEVMGTAPLLAEQLARLPVGQPFGPGATLPWGGGELRIDWAPGHPRRLAVVDGRLVVGGPVESLGPRVRRWLQAEGRARFAADLADYCARAAQPVPALALTSAQRRWGSCSRDPRGQQGTIRLNWRLVMAPDMVRRSVVAHEVAHLVHFNHSPAFHALLGELFEGDLAAANRWLRRHGRALYAPLG